MSCHSGVTVLFFGAHLGCFDVTVKQWWSQGGGGGIRAERIRAPQDGLGPCETDEGPAERSRARRTN